MLICTPTQHNKNKKEIIGLQFLMSTLKTSEFGHFYAFFPLCDVGDQIQRLVHDSQALYQWSSMNHFKMQTIQTNQGSCIAYTSFLCCLSQLISVNFGSLEWLLKEINTFSMEFTESILKISMEILLITLRNLIGNFLPRNSYKLSC
jgi:hypothetical protein